MCLCRDKSLVMKLWFKLPCTSYLFRTFYCSNQRWLLCSPYCASDSGCSSSNITTTQQLLLKPVVYIFKFSYLQQFYHFLNLFLIVTACSVCFHGFRRGLSCFSRAWLIFVMFASVVSPTQIGMINRKQHTLENIVK